MIHRVKPAPRLGHQSQFQSPCFVGIHGEHSESEGGVYDISNKRRLGLTELECTQMMYDGVHALLAKEKELETSSGSEPTYVKSCYAGTLACCENYDTR